MNSSRQSRNVYSRPGLHASPFTFTSEPLPTPRPTSTSLRWGYKGEDELYDLKVDDVPKFDVENWDAWSSSLLNKLSDYQGAIEVLKAKKEFNIDAESRQGLEYDLYQKIISTISPERVKDIREHISANSHHLERKGSVIFEIIETLYCEYLQVQGKAELHQRQQGVREASRRREEAEMPRQHLVHLDTSRRGDIATAQEQVQVQVSAQSQVSESINEDAVDEPCIVRRQSSTEGIEEDPTLEEIYAEFKRASRVAVPRQGEDETLLDYGLRLAEHYKEAAENDADIPESIKITEYIQGLFERGHARQARQVRDEYPEYRFTKMAALTTHRCRNLHQSQSAGALLYSNSYN